MKKLLGFFLLILPIFFTSCKSAETPQELLQKNEIFLTAPAMAVTVTREDCPAIEVAPGTQVMWTNADAVTLAIKLEQLDDSGAVLDTENYEVVPGGILTKVFDTQATYRYTCSENMNWYSTIVVK